MKFVYLLIVSLVVSLEGKVPITVYYEALCSDSMKLIARDIYPNYEYFKEHMEIQFVPYGKAMHSLEPKTKKFLFSCQHGKEECKGNIFHACALELTANDQDTSVKVVTCLMSSSNPANVYAIETCAKKYELDLEKILECGLSSQGDALLAKNGDKTWKLTPNIYFVPTVVYNNSININTNDQDESISNFRDTMCKKIAEANPSDVPEICKHSGLLRKIKNIFW